MTPELLALAKALRARVLPIVGDEPECVCRYGSLMGDMLGHQAPCEHGRWTERYEAELAALVDRLLGPSGMF